MSMWRRSILAPKVQLLQIELVSTWSGQEVVAIKGRHSPELEVTVLAVEREIGDIDLARASKNGGRIPSYMAVVVDLCLGHD